MRLCTVSSIVAVSRIRRDCHEEAKPSISTTKPVAENSVTASVVSARHSASTDRAALRDRELAERRVDVAQREQDARAFGERELGNAGWIVTARLAGSRPIASLSLRPM
jgi:hypothetical protein